MRLIRASGHCIPIHDVGLAALSADKSSGASVRLHATAVRSGDCICKKQRLSGRPYAGCRERFSLARFLTAVAISSAQPAARRAYGSLDEK